MQIEKYTPKITPCPFDWTTEQLASMGGYNPKTDKLAPFKQLAQEVTAEDLMWNMALAIEAGHCKDDKTFLRSLFKKREDVYHVCSLIEAYDEEGEWWMNDRLFNAFFPLLGNDESKARTFAALAEALKEKADEEFPRIAKERA